MRSTNGRRMNRPGPFAPDEAAEAEDDAAFVFGDDADEEREERDEEEAAESPSRMPRAMRDRSPDGDSGGGLSGGRRPEGGGCGGGGGSAGDGHGCSSFCTS